MEGDKSSPLPHPGRQGRSKQKALAGLCGGLPLLKIERTRTHKGEAREKGRTFNQSSPHSPACRPTTSFFLLLASCFVLRASPALQEAFAPQPPSVTGPSSSSSSFFLLVLDALRARHPSVDVNGLSSDEGGGGRGQEHEGARQLARLCGAVHSAEALAERGAQAFAEGLVLQNERRADGPWSHGVAADASFGEGLGEAPHDPDLRRFGSGVADVRVADERVNGAGEGDGAAAMVFEVWDSILREVEIGERVDGHNAFCVLTHWGEGLLRLLGKGDGGVADESGETAELRDDAIDPTG